MWGEIGFGPTWLHRAHLSWRRVSWLLKQIRKWTSYYYLLGYVICLELIYSKLLKGSTFIKKKKNGGGSPLPLLIPSVANGQLGDHDDKQTSQIYCVGGTVLPLPAGQPARPITSSSPDIKIQLLSGECFLEPLPKPGHLLSFGVKGAFESRPRAPPRLCWSRLEEVKSMFLKPCLHDQARTSHAWSLFTSYYLLTQSIWSSGWGNKWAIKNTAN